VPDTLPVETTAASLAGQYRLTIVGTAGHAAGRVARGALELWAPPDSFQYVRQADGQRNPWLTIPLIGTTTIDLEQVGGVENGGWATTRPEAPGIALWEFHADDHGKLVTAITLHLGADGNRRDVRQLDGPYNAFYVDRIEPSGFSGRWHASLGYTSYKAEGHFCATRE
jgi:hypothetical protein